MSSSILIVGSFIQDLTFHVARFPAPGETLLGEFVTGPGGKGSNQAVAAARTGVPTAFAGAVGNDAFGDGAEKFHTAEGIEHHFLRIADTPTGTAGISVNAQGQNHIIVALGASGRFGPEAIEDQWILDAEVLVLQFEIAPETVAGDAFVGGPNEDTNAEVKDAKTNDALEKRVKHRFPSPGFIC
jgi:ribokinase